MRIEDKLIIYNNLEATLSGTCPGHGEGESLTHRFAVPPLPQAGEGYRQLIFCRHTKVYKLQDAAEGSPSRRVGRIERCDSQKLRIENKGLSWESQASIISSLG